MTRFLPVTLAVAALAFTTSALVGCDASPTAHASAGAAEVETFVLRDDMTISANQEAVVLRVNGAEIALRPVEMFALSMVAHRAAFDQFTDEQREIYQAGDLVYAGKGGGDECQIDPRFWRRSDPSGARAVEGGIVFAQPFVFNAPRGGGDGDPCPPPPSRRLTPDLADLLFGDYFDIGSLPDSFEPAPAAGGFNLYD